MYRPKGFGTEFRIYLLFISIIGCCHQAKPQAVSSQCFKLHLRLIPCTGKEKHGGPRQMRNPQFSKSDDTGASAKHRLYLCFYRQTFHNIPYLGLQLLGVCLKIFIVRVYTQDSLQQSHMVQHVITFRRLIEQSSERRQDGCIQDPR